MDQQDILQILKKEKGRGRTQGIFIGIGIMLAVVLCGAIWIGIGLGVFRYLTTGAVFTNGRVLSTSDADKLSVINDVIEKYYLEEYDENDLKESMYKGYVAGLSDPYSQYYTKKEFSDLMEDNNGTFTGKSGYADA